MRRAVALGVDALECDLHDRVNRTTNGPGAVAETTPAGMPRRRPGRGSASPRRRGRVRLLLGPKGPGTPGRRWRPYPRLGSWAASPSRASISTGPAQVRALETAATTFGRPAVRAWNPDAPEDMAVVLALAADGLPTKFP